MKDEKLYHGSEEITDVNRQVLDRQFIELNENSGEPQQFRYSTGLILQEYSDAKVEGMDETIAELCLKLKIGEMLDTTCGFKIIRIF
jgi:hypothetical protein